MTDVIHKYNLNSYMYENEDVPKLHRTSRCGDIVEWEEGRSMWREVNSKLCLDFKIKKGDLNETTQGD